MAVILSAQCTDKKVNEVTAKLFPKLRRAKGQGLRAKGKTVEQVEIEYFANVEVVELEQDIKSTGFYRNKARNIQGAAKMILEKFGGKLPRTMAEMLTIPGVARKTANVVLGNAYGVVEGIAVDTHVLRLSQRLRLVDPEQVGSGKKPIYFSKRHASTSSSRTSEARSGIYKNDLHRFRVPSSSLRTSSPGMTLDYYKDASPEKIEQSLMKSIPEDDWFELTYLLIDHGRAICKAQKPVCANCSLNKLCPASRV